MEKYSVAVIGHGPSIVGKQLGKYIDKCNIVIRMIECDWQNEVDYGTKYNIGIYATGGSEEYLRMTERIPSLCWWEYDAKGTKVPIDAHEPDVFIKKVRTKIVRLLRSSIWAYVEEGKKKFSRGTAAAIVAMQLFTPSHLYLVGFDDVARGSMKEGEWHPAELRQYLIDNKKSPGRSLNSHDWVNEKKVISVVAFKHKVEVIFPHDEADFR